MALVNDPGVTQRLPATSLLTIDSEDRFNSQEEKRALAINVSPYDFSIFTQGPVLPGYVRRMGVSEVVFPWTIPNINPKSNVITVKYIVGGVGPITTAYVTLDNGFYSPAELASALQALIRLLDPSLIGFTMVYGVDAYPIFSYASNSTTTIGFDEVLANYSTGGPAPYYPYDYGTTKQLFDILGFSAQNRTTVQTSGKGFYTFCQYTRYVDIVCPQLTQFQGLADSSTQKTVRDALCRVYLADNQTMMNVSPADPDFAPPGCRPFVIYRNFNNVKNISWNGNASIGSTLTFKVYDDVGQLLSTDSPFKNGGDFMDWSMTILASEN
jgi:hypothetical protein